MMNYYRLLDEPYVPEDRWFLKGLNIVDSNKVSVWKFVSPAEVELEGGEQLQIGVREGGKPLDFTFADFEVPIVNEKVALLLSKEDCQLLPVAVDGFDRGHLYFVSVILTAIDCLDEGRSNFEKFMINDAIRPDKVGEYKAIYKLFVDPTKIPGNSIFRLGKADHIIIISEELKRKFEQVGITGVKFQEVT